MENLIIPKPTEKQVAHYLNAWDKNESMKNYYLQENALDRLFKELCPKNEEISDVLLKVATLNEFYSTNIYSVNPVAQHIFSLKIDNRLKLGDTALVSDIQKVTVKDGVKKNFYSFASKYCSHHNPDAFPIYDSYVEKVLCYFRNKDTFLKFKNKDLKDYEKFKNIIFKFREYYKLEKYTVKDIDKYLWQLGKEYFPKNYNKKQ